MEHSRTPWCGCNEGNCSCCQIWSKPDDHPVAKIECGDWGDEYPTLKLEGPSLDIKAVPVMDKIVYGSIDSEMAKANVKFIVEACNNYDRLQTENKELKKTIPEDVRLFIYTITLFLQAHRGKTPRQMDAAFQEAYHLYVKYKVEAKNELQNP